MRVVRLSGGKDPAEIMLNYGVDFLTNEVNNAILDNDFLLSKLLENYSKDIPEDKVKASAEFFQYLDVLQSDIQKKGCLEQFCMAFNIDLEDAKRDYQNRKTLQNLTPPGPKSEKTEEKKQTPYRLTAELRAVLTAVSDDQSLFKEMRNEISVDDLDEQQSKELFILLEETLRSGNFSVSSILIRCESEELKSIIIQTIQEFEVNARESCKDAIRMLKSKVLVKEQSQILNRIRKLERSSLPEDRKLLLEFISRKMEIDSKISQLKVKK